MSKTSIFCVYIYTSITTGLCAQFVHRRFGCSTSGLCNHHGLESLLRSLKSFTSHFRRGNYVFLARSPRKLRKAPTVVLIPPAPTRRQRIREKILNNNNRITSAPRYGGVQREGQRERELCLLLL